MKIKELKTLFASIAENLDFKYEEMTEKRNNGNFMIVKFSNLINFRKGIAEIETTNLLKDEITNIIKSGIFTTTTDTLKLNQAEGKSLKVQLDEIRKIVKSLNKTFTDLSGITRENTVSIKLPIINDFKDLSEITNIFHTILSQSIINDEINGEVKIDSVENGSIWLDVYLGSSAALTLVAGLAWSAAVIYKKINEGKIVEQHVRSLKIKNDSLNEIKEAQKKTIDLMIDSEANQLYSENFSGEKDNEQIERLKHTIKLLSEQIENGAEIHPALNAPEKVSNLFPDMKHLELIESKIKKLNQ